MRTKEETKDNHAIKLKPRKHKGLTQTHPGMKKALNAVWGAVRASSASRRKATRVKNRSVIPVQNQRAAVRVTYVGPKTPGLWKAHGTYLQRESATGAQQAGFTENTSGVKLGETLDSWQKANDPRLFKIILSPEFGEKIDLERYTRDVMTAIQKDVSAPLEWVAVAHYNTDHPHVHIALRSVTRDDRELHFPKDYIRTSIRNHAQSAATQQIGYRAQQDIDLARQKEVRQQRLTAIDRNLARLIPAGQTAGFFEVTINARAAKGLRSDRQANIVAMAARLRHLETMGLAVASGQDKWTVPVGFTDVLKTAQIAGDRQRTFARQMANASDANLPFLLNNWNTFTALSGRVLGHGEDEAKGSHFMLIEGTDGRIHHLPHRKETEALRAQQELRSNEFVILTKERGRLRIEQLGDANVLLTQQTFLRRQPAPEYGTNPRPGWLGAYDQAIMLHNLAQEAQMPNTAESPTAQKSRPTTFMPRITAADATALLRYAQGPVVAQHFQATLNEKGTDIVQLKNGVSIIGTSKEQAAKHDIDRGKVGEGADAEGVYSDVYQLAYTDKTELTARALIAEAGLGTIPKVITKLAPVETAPSIPGKQPRSSAPTAISGFKQLLSQFPKPPAKETNTGLEAQNAAPPAGTLMGPRELAQTQAPANKPQLSADDFVKLLKSKLPVPELRDLKATTNTKTGEVTYSLGAKPALVDSDKTITVIKHDPVATRIALELAVEKYGKVIDANGTPEFQAQLIDAAVAMKRDVTFSDSALQARLQKALQAERSAIASQPASVAATKTITGLTTQTSIGTKAQSLTTPLLLNKDQTTDYLKKTGKEAAVDGVVRSIEADQKFQIDVEGGKISFNDIEMGGEEGRALYANVTAEGREKIMEKLSIDDSAAVKQAQLWVKDQAEKRVELEKQVVAIQEATPSPTPGSVAAKDAHRRANEQAERQYVGDTVAVEYGKALAIAAEAFGDLDFDIDYAKEQDSQYKGEILGSTDEYVVMRQDDTVVLHEKEKLARVPETGKRVDIQYGGPKDKANVITIGTKRTQKELEI